MHFTHPSTKYRKKTGEETTEDLITVSAHHRPSEAVATYHNTDRLLRTESEGE
jgi:hypothetical protein